MAEMVASALLQEGVSGFLWLAASNREERASQGHLMERLAMAQSELELALERSSKMPIADVSLLRRRMIIKCAFKECTVELHKHKQLVLADEEAEKSTVPVSSSLLCMKIMHAVQPSVWSFSSPKKDMLTRSDIARFEWFVEKADKFVRDVESGCSLLARCRFLNPIVTQLLEGKHLVCISGQGKKRFFLDIGAFVTEEHGVMAELTFGYRDPKAPMNAFSLGLHLRLSESTNIVEVSAKCLRSLGADFKCLAEVATGQLAHLSTQLRVSNGYLLLTLEDTIGFIRPDPVCCTSSGLNNSCTSNTSSSELSCRFPEEVSWFCFSCNISGEDYNLPRSTRQVNGNTLKACPYLELRTTFIPHFQWAGGPAVSTLHHMEEAIHREAINCFSSQPKQKEYTVLWASAHGAALFTVTKPTIDMTYAPKTIGDGFKRKR